MAQTRAKILSSLQTLYDLKITAQNVSNKLVFFLNIVNDIDLKAALYTTNPSVKVCVVKDIQFLYVSVHSTFNTIHSIQIVI